MRKSIILSISAVFFALTLSGCSENNITSNMENIDISNDTAYISDNEYSGISDDITFISENCDYYKNGVVFGNEKAMFLDFDTMEKAPLCAAPNCTHTGLDCLANLMGNTPVFYNNYIYFFSSDCGVNETPDGNEFYINSKLMKASLDSSATEVVCEFHDCTPPEKFGKYVLYKNELFFVGDDQNPVKDSYGGLGWGNTGGNHFLCSINLDSGKYTNYGSIYDGDKEYEAAAYSSSAKIAGIYNKKMYIEYTFVEDMESLDSGNFQFTYLNFEFDFANKKWKESELPSSCYMNNNTYIYYDSIGKQIRIIYKEKEINILYDYEVRNCSEFNGKLFMPDEEKWFDLTDSSEHSLGEYSGYQTVGYTDDCYILINGGRTAKITEEQLMSL